MQNSITNGVYWLETCIQPHWYGTAITTPHEHYVTGNAKIKIPSQKIGHFIDKSFEIDQSEGTHEIGVAFLVNSRLFPLEITSKNGGKTYKVLTFFTEEILKDDKLSGTERAALLERLKAGKSFAFLIRAIGSDKVDYIALHENLGFFKKLKTLHGLGIARFNQEGAWTKENMRTNKEGNLETRTHGKTKPGLPTGFNVELLQDAKLICVKDNVYQKLEKSMSDILK